MSATTAQVRPVTPVEKRERIEQVKDVGAAALSCGCLLLILAFLISAIYWVPFLLRMGWENGKR